MALLPQPRQPSLFWALFGLRGRISRRTFWMIQAALICVNSVLFAQLMGVEEASFHDLAVEAAPIVAALTLASNIAVGVKRLHDVGLSGFIAVALLIPVVNVFATIWIGVMPGDPDVNQYGSGPDSPV